MGSLWARYMPHGCSCSSTARATSSGCLLALGGLGLFFGGVIHAYWWAIVAGLYGVGVLGWPRSDLAETAEQTELSTEMLAQQVRKLVDSVAPGLPKDSLDRLRSIQGTLNELFRVCRNCRTAAPSRRRTRSR